MDNKGGLMDVVGNTISDVINKLQEKSLTENEIYNCCLALKHIKSQLKKLL